jgi:hypothetical protein
MPIRPDPAYAQAVSKIYGEFLGIYESEHGQVQASLFKKRNFLVAYLAYEKGLELSQFTDPYLDELHRYASEHGLQLQIKHVVN